MKYGGIFVRALCVKFFPSARGDFYGKIAHWGRKRWKSSRGRQFPSGSRTVVVRGSSLYILFSTKYRPKYVNVYTTIYRHYCGLFFFQLNANCVKTLWKSKAGSKVRRHKNLRWKYVFIMVAAALLLKNIRRYLMLLKYNETFTLELPFQDGKFYIFFYQIFKEFELKIIFQSLVVLRSQDNYKVILERHSIHLHQAACYNKKIQKYSYINPKNCNELDYQYSSRLTIDLFTCT